MVRLDLIDPSPYQPRTGIPAPELEDLAESIERDGLIQPVAVRRVGDRYQLVAGHRRTAALRLLCERAQDDRTRDRYTRVPAVVMNVTDEEASVLALTENVARVDLNPVEIGDAIARVQEQFGLAAEVLALRVGLPVDRVRRLLKLRAAPQVIRDAVTVGLTVEGESRVRRKLDLIAALELARLFKSLHQHEPKNAEARIERHVQRVLAEGWPLRRIQAFCKAAIGGPEQAEPVAHDEARGVKPSSGPSKAGLRLAGLNTAEHVELGTLLERVGQKGSVLEILKRLVNHLHKPDRSAAS